MRFDDVLQTVRTIDLSNPAAASAAWRQIVDLVGRGRADADDWAVSTLTDIRDRIPLAARAASARALFGARPPLALVRLLALDDVAVAAPVLRGAALADDEWCALLPALSPTARAILRHRRDLSAAVTRALESFGATDFVLGDGAAQPVSIASPVVAPPAEPGPFVSLGTIARGLPVVAEALRRGNDNEAPPPHDGTFRIADVVARLEAFQKRQAEAAPPAAEPASTPPERAGFRFETDAGGTIRWVDREARDAIMGIDLARPARPARPGVDGVAAGAFRRRARFGDANLLVGGTGGMAGRWLATGVPVFDPATGRFTGYRGVARRPRADEGFAAVAPAPSADSLRQLMHELRTPTNAIAGFSEMIEHEMLGPVEPVYRDQAATMRDDAHRLLSAIDDLDAAARIAAGALPLDPQPIAIAPLLERLTADVGALAAERGAVVSLEAASLIAVADARSLDRAVLRLLGAAIGAAAAGEAIAVRGIAADGGRIGIVVTRPRAFAGHPGDAILTIDEEESPASLLGVGFALRLVRNLARALGGSLDLGERDLTLHLPAARDRTGGVELTR